MFGELILEIFLPSAVQQHLRSTPLTSLTLASRARHKKAPSHRPLCNLEASARRVQGSLVLAGCGVTLSFSAVDSHFLGWALVLEGTQGGPASRTPVIRAHWPTGRHRQATYPRAGVVD